MRKIIFFIFLLNMYLPTIQANDDLIIGSGRDLEGRKAWVPNDEVGSTFTDPKKHNPEKFQYIIHAISEGSDEAENPEIMKNWLLSTSLINQDFQTTWYDMGYILRVPTENIYASHCNDIGTNNRAIDAIESLRNELSKKNNEYGIKSPAVVFEEKSRDSKTPWTEVLVIGKGTNNKTVEVIGGFVREGYDRSTETKKFVSFLERNDLPVVKLKKEASISELPPWL